MRRAIRVLREKFTRGRESGVDVERHGRRVLSMTMQRLQGWIPAHGSTAWEPFNEFPQYVDN